MQPKHSAIVAGLTLALSFGAVAAPVTAVAEEPTPGVASDATNIDKGLYTQQSFSGVLRSVQGVSLVNVTDEMKYFSKYESHGNYNQGFSYGDGYNALGYYQFDRRWSLIPFMRQAYNYNPEKYSMLKDAIDRGSEISNAGNAMSENGQLTELGRIAQDAFLGAYNTDPEEFSALQDAYAYNSYYAVTESWLKSALGIDISGRADCVKGMVWSITNMCGTGGCQDFFRWANLSNNMTDREFVTALSGSVVNNVAKKYPNQSKYHPGWRNRYSNELNDCLVYIAEDEKEAANKNETTDKNEAADKNAAADKNEAADKKPSDSEATQTPGTSQTPEVSKPAEKFDTDNNESNGGETNKPATGGGSNNTGSPESSNGSTGNGSSKPSNGSSGSSAGAGFGSNDGSGSNNSKDDSNKGADVPVFSTDKKPSAPKLLGSKVGSLVAGANSSLSSNKNNVDQNSVTKTDATQADSKDNKSEDTSEKPETDKGSGSEEKKDNSEEKDNKSGGGKNNGDRTDSAGDNKENTGDNKDGAGDNKDNNSGGKNDSGSGNGNAGTSGGNMPKTGDLIVMASLASASLATLGATSIVSGKHKLDQQKKAAGQNDSEE